MASHEKTKIPANIKPEKIGKGILAYFLDTLLCGLIILTCYYSFGRPLILPAVGHEAAVNSLDDFMEGSGLVSVDRQTHKHSYLEYVDKKEGETVVSYAYEQYVETVWKYFTVTVPAEGSLYAVNPAKMDSVGGRTFHPLEGEVTPVTLGRFVYENFFNAFAEGTPWVTPLDEHGDPDYTKAPTVKPDVAPARLNILMHNQTRDGVYDTAVSHVVLQARYSDLQNEIRAKAWFAIMPWFALAALIVFEVIPLAVGNGRSVGKLIAGTAVLNNDGYKAPWWKVALHYAFPVLYWSILTPPYAAITFSVFFLLHVVDYIFLPMSKNHQSLHDKIVGTIVVNARTSTWFASKEDEDEYVASHPNSYVASLRQQESEQTFAEALEEEAFAARESIIDSSTIGKARKIADTIDSFDEFESREDKPKEGESKDEPKE